MPKFSQTLIPLGCLAFSLFADDQPQWGAAWSRNMVSTERNLPDGFDPKTGRSIKWSIPLGTETHSTPVIANGRVYIGTNNGQPRDPKHQGDRGVLMCLNEKDGALLWQLVVPKREEDPYLDWPKSGISSPATVDGNVVYTVTSRGEVVALDPEGMANGNDGTFQFEGKHMARTNFPAMEPGSLDGDILWLYDLTSGAGIWSHDGAHSSILVHGNYLYLNSGTGVDNTHRRIRTPDAPSLVVLDKRTGRLVAREFEGIAPHIFHCTWSSPSMATVNGKELLFFAGGNGIVYAFEPYREIPGQSTPAPLKKVWQFDIDPTAPKTDVHRYTGNKREGPSNIFGMPVFDRGELFVAGGGDIWWGKNDCWLKAFSASGSGDITASNESWTFPLSRHVLSSPAVTADLVFIADCGGMIYCLDRKNGKELWSHELGGEIWASPYVADGKVYLGTRRGLFAVFAAAPEKQLLSELKLSSGISATVTAANGVLYLATMDTLHALTR
ncbi:MAG: PQQ-binding-like beta-propeller repeat protein [Verrucomicrobiota bacterium]|nr:PQQ-binding-like beta-propeller repeat protein [Verrucomicrobiota bacterium]